MKSTDTMLENDFGGNNSRRLFSFIDGLVVWGKKYKRNKHFYKTTSARNRAGVRDIISLYDTLFDSGGACTMLGPIVQYT